MRERLQKISVLFVLTALHKDGAVLSTLTTIKHLDRSRFYPRLFVLKAMQNTGDHPDAWTELLQNMEVVFGFPEGEKAGLKYFQVFKTLYRLTKESDIVVGGLEMAPTFLSVLAGKLAGKPSAAFIRNSLPQLIASLPTYYKLLTRLFYPFLDKGIAISNGIKNSTESLFPKLRGRISTVYIPIDIQRIRRLAEKSTEAPLGPDKYLLAVGRLMPQKGFDVLLKAYAIAKKEGLTHKLVIIGEGPERHTLENFISTEGLTQNVMLAGFQENPYIWMKHADVFISSSRFEGFCRVLAEAQALGTPVISTDCPEGPAEVLQGGESGVLVETENPEELSKAILSLLNDPEKIKEFRHKGLERVEQFTFINTVNKFGEILTELYQSKNKS